MLKHLATLHISTCHKVYETLAMTTFFAIWWVLKRTVFCHFARRKKWTRRWKLTWRLRPRIDVISWRSWRETEPSRSSGARENWRPRIGNVSNDLILIRNLMNIYICKTTLCRLNTTVGCWRWLLMQL